MNRPAREIVAQHFDYDPATGVLRWRVKRRAVNPGDIAGTISKTLRGRRYRRVNFFGQRYPASHLIWVLMTGEWPSVQIDHRNRDSLDNRWDNLCAAFRSQNQGLNQTGYRGVSLDKINNRWVARIKSQHVGRFNTAEEAARAYDVKAKELYGEFAYLNFPSEPRGTQTC